MTKQKKKRSKQYRGEDARTRTTSSPTVHHYQAVERSQLGEWWHSRKRIVKPLAITVGAIGFVVWLLVELFRTLS